jgi:DNA-binding MarR family transcriptional regulator
MRTKVPGRLYTPAPRLNQLRILEQIAANHDITQSELAHSCALSVAMVNNYMKELCERGLLEYRRKTSKTISYHVTEAGQETADSTRDELLRELLDMSADARDWVRTIIMKQTRKELRRAVIYGTGTPAEIVFHALESAGANIIGVCSDDPQEIGTEWCGRQIVNPSQIRFLAPDAVIVAVDEGCEEVCRRLMPLAQSRIEIIAIARSALQVCEDDPSTQTADQPAQNAGRALGTEHPHGVPR